MNRTADKTILSLVQDYQQLLPFLYLAGVRDFSEKISVSDYCKKKGLNENFILTMIEVANGSAVINSSSFPAYNIIQLSEICKESYAVINGLVINDLISLKELLDRKFSDIDFFDEILRLSEVEKEIGNYCCFFKNHVFTHIQQVYELYYSPGFTSKGKDLLKYSIEFYKGGLVKSVIVIENIVQCLYRKALEKTIEISDLYIINDFLKITQLIKTLDNLEQKLLRPMVIKMEESVFISLQKKRIQVKRNSFIEIDNKEFLEAEVISQREKEVLRLLALGLTNKEIAEILSIAVTTIITHRKKIVEKLGIKTIPGLTVYAFTHGLIDENILINED